MTLKKYLTFITENIISTEMFIPNDVKEISKAFNRAGKDLYVVGGAVRDFLQKKIPHDFDLVTNALPEESKSILKDWNVSDEQGKNFGVLRIYTEDEPLGYELAVYRHDVSGGRDTKGDDQKVEIGKHITIADDCKRRDLTQNALYYNIDTGKIIDLVGGVKDIENNVIRAVGDPAKRFKEDRLRILRVFRFAARAKGGKGGIISPETSKAIKNDNRLRGISTKEDVSQERIHEEWNKVIEHAEKGGNKILENYIRLLTEYDMWEEMFPKMDINTDIKIPNLNSAEIFSLIFFNNDIPKLKRYMVRDLKFNVNLVNEIEFLTEFLKSFNSNHFMFDVYKLAKLKNRFNIDDDQIRNFLFGDTNIESFINYCNDGFVINGNDLSAEGFKGREIEREKERREVDRFKNDYLINDN